MDESQLKLSETAFLMLRQHIDSAPHEEVCGLIGGLWRPYPKLAIGQILQAIPNSDDLPAIRYTMQPEAQVKALMDFDKQGLELVAIYHSHPQGEAVPSQTDIAEAAWSDVVYVIGVPQGAIKAWRIVKGKVWAVGLVVG